MDDDFVGVLGCHRPDRRNHVVHQRADREALDVQVHSAGFDLREVEDVVDELEKMMRRTQDALEWLRLLGALQVARILEQHLGQADDGIQRRTQLVRHVRQELRFQLARFRQLLALRLALLEQPRILDGQHRLRGERLQQPHGRGREFTRDLAPDHQRAGYVLVAQQRHGDHRADSVPPDDAYPARCLDVRHLHGRPLRRARSHGTVRERDVQAAQRRDHLVADAEVRARTEDPLRLVELVERSRIRLAQAHRAGDDGSEHRLEVEGRAHRLADLVQHLKLRHRAHQLARARLHLRGALGDPLLEAALILLDLELRQAQLLAHHPQRREEVPEIALREPIGRHGELACRDALGEIHRGVERLGDAGDHAVHEPGGDQQREEGCGRHRPALPPRRVDRLSDGLAARLLVAFVERADGLAGLSDLRLKRQQLLDRHRVRDLPRQGVETGCDRGRNRILATQRGGRGRRLLQRLVGALAKAADVHGVRGVRHEGLEAVLRRAREIMAHHHALDRSRAPQVRHRLVDQHQRDRSDDDDELREDAQLQLFYFYHWDDAPPGAEPTPGIPTKRNAHFYAVRGGASTKLTGIKAAKAE